MGIEKNYLVAESKDFVEGAPAAEFEAHTTTADIHKKITVGTADPTGGEDGDIYLKITE